MIRPEEECYPLVFEDFVKDVVVAWFEPQVSRQDVGSALRLWVYAEHNRSKRSKAKVKRS